ncbi:MAG: SPFH/Band 7/PHB domain protein [Clostridia bacterium]|nr:SPFH/Band 7/PHB domain protein [Clostridia bacterium]MBO5777843.1 SPFH/Band 7/PHB domain protein [Clostridia bacterium]MBO7222348.1 SPFH/Band 7/PHB domain protein [Clostridia bacterium]
MFTLTLSALTPGAIVAIIIPVALVIGLLIASIRVVKEKTAYTVERLGKYNRTLNSGFHMIIPFIERVSNKISLKEQVADFPPQPVITKDNVTMHIDTVVYFCVTDPKLFTYGVENPRSALENLTATTLRNIVGDLELDDTLTSRDTVNAQLCIILDEATDPWGIKVNRVELKNILPPKDIQEAMEKQMRAERERRESILKAEGEKRSNILVAEGAKAAAILRAEAKKEALIAEAEGQATAIKMIIDAHPDEAYIKLQSFEALKALAVGQSTKIVVPTDIANITGALTAGSEIVKMPETPVKPAKK